jgi:hypothetical protein
MLQVYVLRQWWNLSDPKAEELRRGSSRQSTRSSGGSSCAKGGASGDATIIAAPSAIRHVTGTRAPDMKQTRKAQQWYFGMKV